MRIHPILNNKKFKNNKFVSRNKIVFHSRELSIHYNEHKYSLFVLSVYIVIKVFNLKYTNLKLQINNTNIHLICFIVSK